MDDRHDQRINNILEEGMAGKKKRNPLSGGGKKLTITELYDNSSNCFCTRVESTIPQRRARKEKVIYLFALCKF